MDRTGPGKWANDRQLRRRPLETPFNLSRICGCIKNSGASSPASGNLRGNSDWCKIQHALDLRVSLQLPWLCYTLLHASSDCGDSLFDHGLPRNLQKPTELYDQESGSPDWGGARLVHCGN